MSIRCPPRDLKSPRGRLRPKVQPLTFLQTIFDSIGAFRIPSIAQFFTFLITAVNVPSFKYECITKPRRSLHFFSHSHEMHLFALLVPFTPKQQISLPFYIPQIAITSSKGTCTPLASNGLGTKPPCWRARETLAQEKAKRRNQLFIISNGNLFVLSQYVSSMAVLYHFGSP